MGQLVPEYASTFGESFKSVLKNKNIICNLIYLHSFETADHERVVSRAFVDVEILGCWASVAKFTSNEAHEGFLGFHLCYVAGPGSIDKKLFLFAATFIDLKIM